MLDLMTACCFSMEVCYYLCAHAKHIRAEMLNSNTKMSGNYVLLHSPLEEALFVKSQLPFRRNDIEHHITNVKIVASIEAHVDYDEEVALIPHDSERPVFISHYSITMTGSTS